MRGDVLTKFSIARLVEIQRNILERGERNAISRRLRKKDNNEAITTWGLDLNKIFYALMCILLTYA